MSLVAAFTQQYSVCCELGGFFLDHLYDFKEVVVIKVISLDLSILNNASRTCNV